MIKFLLIIVFSLTYLFANSTVCTSTGDGDWTNSATWSCGRAPIDGDTIVVDSGDLVTVNCVCGIYTNMRIEIYGELYFDNGMKITMDSTGVVQIYAGGKVSGGNGGSKITIGGEDKWDANDGDLIGPVYSCDTCDAFDPGVIPIELIN